VSARGQIGVNCIVSWRAAPSRLQVEELFQAAQVRNLEGEKPAAKQLALLDVKRATGIGIRMAGLRWLQLSKCVNRRLCLPDGCTGSHQLSCAAGHREPRMT
jgi:hypothetical protein